MTATAQTLELIEVSIDPIARPTHSLIVADRAFMTALRQAEAAVAAMKITDAQSAQAAADKQIELTKAGTFLEKSRKELKAPYLLLMDHIDLKAKGPKGRIETLKGVLSIMQTNWTAELRRLAEEAEKARQAELRRLEAVRLAEEKAAKEKADKIAEGLRLKQEADAKAAEEARIAGLPVPEPIVEEVWEEEAPDPIVKTATELAIEAVRFAPAPVITKASGVREVVVLFPHIVEINLVPEMFVTKTLKLAAVQSTFCRSFRKGDKLPECPGIRFEIQESTVSTGKGAF